MIYTSYHSYYTIHLQTIYIINIFTLFHSLDSPFWGAQKSTAPCVKISQVRPLLEPWGEVGSVGCVRLWRSSWSSGAAAPGQSSWSTRSLDWFKGLFSPETPWNYGKTPWSPVEFPVNQSNDNRVIESWFSDDQESEEGTFVFFLSVFLQLTQIINA